MCIRTLRLDCAPRHLTHAVESSYKICHVPHIKQIWDEKNGLNLQRERLRRQRHEIEAEVIRSFTPRPGRQSVELDDIARRSSNREAPVLGVA